MSPILFKVIILFTLPVEQVAVIENFASKYDISTEMMIEQYIREKLDIVEGYIEVNRPDIKVENNELP